MRKVKWLAIALVILTGVLSLVAVIVHKIKADRFEQINMLMQELQTRYNVDLVLYGTEKLPTYCDFQYRMIEHISEDTLSIETDENYYHIVAMTDLFDPLEVTKDELLLMKQFCEERGYAFCYAGKNSRDLMKECGFWSFYSEGECGFSYSGYHVPKEIREGEYDENYYLIINFFERDTQGSKIDLLLNFLFSIETQMDFDLTDGNGLFSVWN